jgi:signal transduction histidine kinase
VSQVVHSGVTELRTQLEDSAEAAVALGTIELATQPEVRVGAYLCAPLRSGGSPIGAMVFGGERPRTIEPGEVALAEELARRAAVALHNARLYEDARRAIQMRQEILATVTHDLRSPLSTISLCGQYLGRQVAADEKLHKQVEMIGRAADQMDGMIRDLLDLSRSEAGYLPVEPRPVRVDELIRQVLEMAAPLGERRAVQLVVGPIAEGEVACDRDRVLRVFANLIGNAIKFSADGEVVELSAVRQGGEVKFGVADRGVGIPASQLERIFQRYWQGEPGDRQGSGLGLYIAKRIIDSHDGRIWAESEIGAGSRFYFTLRLAGG